MSQRQAPYDVEESGVNGSKRPTNTPNDTHETRGGKMGKGDISTSPSPAKPPHNTKRGKPKGKKQGKQSEQRGPPNLKTLLTYALVQAIESYIAPQTHLARFVTTQTDLTLDDGCYLVIRLPAMPELAEEGEIYKIDSAP